MHYGNSCLFPHVTQLKLEMLSNSDVSFEFPDVVMGEKKDKDQEKANDDVTRAKKEFQKATNPNQIGRKGLPTFFGL